MQANSVPTVYPDNNPKAAIGAKKAPLHLVPPSFVHYTSLAFEDGAKKYGAYNWRKLGVSASTYYAAAKRHIDAWWDGEELSADAKVHHLAHAAACLAVLLDAESIGKLIDDRPPAGAASKLQAQYVANKEANDRQVSTNPVSTGDRQIPLFPMAG